MLSMTLMIIMTMTMMITSQGSKWAARRSSCERPRTYDKFYQKTPGNFQVGLRSNILIIIVMAMLTIIITIVLKTILSNQVMHNLQPADERDSAISVCSSEDCDQQVHLAVWQENILRSILRRLSNILFQAEKEQKKRRRPRRSQSERRVRNRTLTERDVKHLERRVGLKSETSSDNFPGT